jgi:hypothetical protein
MKPKRKRLCFFIAIAPYNLYKVSLTGIRTKACGFNRFLLLWGLLLRQFIKVNSRRDAVSFTGY